MEKASVVINIGGMQNRAAIFEHRNRHWTVRLYVDGAKQQLEDRGVLGHLEEKR